MFHRIHSLWERFRWGFSLDDLQACADKIFFKWGGVIKTLESSYANRRRCIHLFDSRFESPCTTLLGFDVQLGEVRLTASNDLGDTVWIAHSKGGKFYMIPRSREVGRLKEL